MGKIFSDHDSYEAYINNNPMRIADYVVDEFAELKVLTLAKPAELVKQILESGVELEQKLKDVDEERVALKTQMQQILLSKNAEIARAKEEARSRGKLEGDAERRRIQSSFQRRLNDKDAEIADLREAMASLEKGSAELYAKLDARDQAGSA